MLAYSKVATQGLQYKSVNFGAEKTLLAYLRNFSRMSRFWPPADDPIDMLVSGLREGERVRVGMRVRVRVRVGVGVCVRARG